VILLPTIPPALPMKMFRSRNVLLLIAAVFSACAAFAADNRKKLVMLIAEHEYETATSLPEFAAKHLAKNFRVVTVTGSLAPGQTAFDDIKQIGDADVLLVSVRRRTPPKEQLDAIRRHITAGKPVVGIRTASHAFSVVRGQKLAEGNAEWTQFDAEVIGGNYTNHHGKGPAIRVTLAADADAKHPILKGVKLPFESAYSLYKNTPLQPGAKPLLTGTIPDKAPEPVAWVFTRGDGGRTFYTSLGGPTDFQNPSFVTLLRNGILWAAK
jgi:type 1 glutamine amidotransferase